MKLETRVTVLISERECRAAQVNAGITIDLPPDTTQVIIRVVRDEEEGLNPRFGPALAT